MKFILTFCCLLFVGVLCIRADSVTVEGTRGPTWGDITGDHAFVQRITKQRIPFIRREETVQHPEVNNKRKTSNFLKKLVIYICFNNPVRNRARDCCIQFTWH